MYCGQCKHCNLEKQNRRYMELSFYCEANDRWVLPNAVFDCFEGGGAQIVEKIIEKEVIKEIIKEIPVEVIKEIEIIKEVEVEKIIERIIKPDEWPCPYCDPIRVYASAGAVKGHITKIHKEEKK